MPEWLQSLGHELGMAVGWIFSPSWLPPKDFQLLRWLVVPGYGYGFLILLFAALEYFRPQQQRKWSRSSLLSATYLVLAAKMGFYGLLVVPLMRHGWISLGLPSAHLDRSLPLALYMPIALLVVTFTAYWSHRLMHRVPLFWNIHKIHHSVDNLNFTSAVHSHFLELLVHTPTHLAATLLLGTDLVAPFGIIFMAIDYLAHSNVRVDFGKLTYIVCTPQAHRVHHSIDERHFDTNFGNTFMIWDHLFGTFYYDPNDEPTRFGVPDMVPRSFVKQQLLPLVWMGRTISSGFKRLTARLGGAGSPTEG